MLASVEKRRDVDARFYKPVCLLAVIDGIDDGSIAPSDMDLDRVCDRFSACLKDVFPDRAAMGWRPFWHLGRDRAWIFRKNGIEVGPDDFRSQRKPNSRSELASRTDHVTVPEEMRGYWRSSTARAELREAVIDMLLRDDAACRRVAAHLGNFFDASGGLVLQPKVDVATDMLPIRSGQGFRGSAAVRRAVELRAMTIATELLTAEGWAVEDVSARQSYDLFCRRDSDVRYVEVKGATGAGEKILITAAEIAFALDHREHMMLIIVSSIVVEEITETSVEARGGQHKSIYPWSPDSSDLTAISYFYSVPC